MLAKMQGKKEQLCTVGGNVNECSTMESSIEVLKKLKIDIPYNLTLGIHLKECKSGYNRVTCTPMFIAVLLTIAKLWKQSSCSTTDEWIKKMWYIYTVEFHSVIKKSELYCLQVNGWK
jgi:hypothetical protein